eukprot:CAMPEP_0197944746 /NCGR_PEP_ID=MMETSP1439-20131203/125565_1 /TAXON_ID=66791 /ORGANISM="Gonyaulax spinifera, Strain CCMP409" /LENGTH=455 /DNA_ID=CAMNT_0043568001 /DNA_START=66 /DNA_END=1433 /DNA_ORIENTATION=-
MRPLTQAAAWLFALGCCLGRELVTAQEPESEKAEDVLALLQTTLDATIDSSATNNESRGAIPFYMYEGDSSLTDWCPAERWLWYKGLADWALHQGLKSHPWRTSDPEKAELFYVPMYLSALVSDKCGFWPALAFQRGAWNLQFSKVFSRAASSHFTTGHYFKVHRNAVGALGGILDNMVILTEDRHTRLRDGWRTVPVPYGDILDFNLMPGVEFWRRQHSLIFMGQADARPAYLDRRIGLTLGRHFPDAVLICIGKCTGNELPICTTQNFNGCRWKGPDSLSMYLRSLVGTRFGLMFRGDTASSARLYDYIAAEVIPVIVSDSGTFERDAMVFADDLPWSDFCFAVSADNFRKDPAGTMRLVTSAPVGHIEDKLRALREVRSSLDWTGDASGSRVPSLVLRDVARKMGKTVDSAPFASLPSVMIERSFELANQVLARHRSDDGEFFDEVELDGPL